MSAIKHFPPPAGVKSPPLSFATRTGELVFVSGIPGFDDKGALPPAFETQFANVVTNLKRASDDAAMNVMYASAFGPAPYPARTTCVVQALPDPAMLIEIECVASLAGT